MQVVLDLGQVPGEEAPVGADGVAAQRDGARLGHVLLMKARVWRAGVLERDRRRLDERQQPGLGVHACGRSRPWPPCASARLVDDEVGSLGDDVELVVGDEGGDLHDHVAVGLEPGHLEVHPDEHGVRR